VKRILVVIALASIPLSLFFASWQAYRYYTVQSGLAVLEAHQRELVEENKRKIVLLTSRLTPSVILERARKELGMSVPSQDQAWTLEIQSSELHNGNQ